MPKVFYVFNWNTFITAQVKATTGKSFAGSETPFQKQTEYQAIKFNENNQALEPYVILFDSAENTQFTGAFAGQKSFDMRVTFNTQDSNISPMIDLQRTSLTGVQNMIDRQYYSSTTSPGSFNAPISFISETSPRGGSAASKHLTRIIRLDDDAVGLKILLTANRPSGTDFEVYFRTATSDEILSDKSFTLQAPESTLPTDDNFRSFREYRYLVGGQGGSLPSFTQAQVKLVVRSTNEAKVPRIRDLRIIALSV